MGQPVIGSCGLLKKVYKLLGAALLCLQLSFLRRAVWVVFAECSDASLAIFHHVLSHADHGRHFGGAERLVIHGIRLGGDTIGSGS